MENYWKFIEMSERDLMIVVITTLSCVIVALAFYIKKMYSSQEKKDRTHNAEHLSMTKQVTEALVMTKVSLDNNTKTIDKVFDTITRLTQK